MNRSELAAIRDRVFAPVEQDPDPMIAAFNRRGLAPTAQLRQWYADATAAAAVVPALDHTIAAVEFQIQQLAWHARTLKPEPAAITADTPIPTVEAAAAYAAAVAHAELLQHFLERYRVLRADADQKRVHAARVFDAARARWAELIYQLDGDSQYLPRGAMVMTTKPDPYERQNLQAALEAMER